MRFTNATKSEVRVVEYDIDTEEFSDRAKILPRKSVLLADVDTAQLEVYEGQHYLVLTRILGVEHVAIKSGGGGVIHEPDDGEPPFGL